jgi:hypothetical protein
MPFGDAIGVDDGDVELLTPVQYNGANDGAFYLSQSKFNSFLTDFKP